MAFYEVSTYKVSKQMPSIPHSVINFFCGGIAGVLSWMIIMPLDVIKSRVQADTKKERFRGFWHCGYHAVKYEGITVLFRGSLAVCLRAFPVNAVTLMVYSEVLRFLNEQSGGSWF